MSVVGDETAWVGRVVSLLRYPLKSARGEQLRAVRVDVEGVRGDRGWACLDEADGTVGSAKHPDRWGRLLEVTAQVDEHSSEVVVQVQGRRAVAGRQQADALLSEHLARPVRLTRSVPEQARLHRRLPEEQGLVPDWMTGAVPGQEMITEVSDARPGGRFVDFGPVHLLTALARHHRTVVGGLGRAACFGMYAEVLRPGQLTLGQVVR